MYAFHNRWMSRIYSTVRPRNDETPADQRGLLVVAPTGIDPVTFRFSVERSTN